MANRIHQVFGIVVMLGLIASAPDAAVAQSATQFPHSIMTPEHGAATHHRVTASKRTRHGQTSRGSAQSLAMRPKQNNLFAAPGSSGSVLPTSLPRTPLILPEGGIPTAHALPQEQGPTVLPGMNPIPNLPHGAETFQDRASRCAFQQGLYGVPNSASTQYMGACTM